MKRNFAFFSGGFAAAIFCIYYGAQSAFIASFLCALAAFICVFLVVKKHCATAIFLLLGIVLGVAFNIAYLKFDANIPIEIDNKSHFIGAYVTDYSRENKSGNRIYFTAEVYSIDGEKIDKPMKVMVYYPDMYARLNPGDGFSAKAKFSLPENTEDFDANAYYKNRGIDAFVFAEKDGMIFRADEVPFKYLYKTLRFKIWQKINRLLPEKESGFLNALLIGDKTNLPEYIKEEMRITGLSHTIAISGMHVTFLVSLLIMLFGRKYGCIIAVPTMFLFVLIAGGTPSITRAFVMQCFMIFAPVFMREDDPVTSLLAALFVILLRNPYAIADVGMQLSFMSMLGLILLSGKINNKILGVFPNKKWKWYRRGINAASKTISATVSATLFTMPIIVYYYGTVSLIALVSNLAILWMVSLLFHSGIIMVVLGFLWNGTASVVAVVLTWFIDTVVSMVHVLSNIPFASVYAKNTMAVVGLCVLYIGLIVGYIGYRKKNKFKYFAPASVLVCAIFIFMSTYTPTSKEIEFTTFDVGQGLSVMAEMRGKRVVIDCGGDGGENPGSTVYKEIIKRNTRKIDAFVLTHAHYDHTNGAEMLLAKANVKELYIPSRLGGSDTIKKIVKTAHERGTKVYAVEKDKTLSFDDMKIKLLCSYDQEKENDTGIAVVATKGNFDVVITGDLEKKAEEYLVNERNLPNAEVYIVGHHGSNSSSSEYLLNKINPEYAVISVGKNNSYRHPSEKTLSRLRSRGIEYRRTDEVGTIRFNSGELFKEEE